jgi:phosphatidylglycerophosphatase A
VKRCLMSTRSTAIRHNIALWFATCGSIGYLPFMPGTLASLLACFLLFFFPGLFAHPFFVVFFVGVALLSVHMVLEKGLHDPSWVVIDELAGMFITMVGHGTGPWSLLKGFILFRLFDILKPYPIRRAERLPGTWGIVADDVAAGLFANIALTLLGRL